MSSMPRSPSALNHEFRRHSADTPQHTSSSEPDSFRYSHKICTSCGYQYKSGTPKSELGNSATSTWKHLNVEITEHYHSCPKTFRNILPPTSAIRDTLIEPAANHQRWKDRLKSAPSYAPYPRPSHRESCRVDGGCTRCQSMRFASPESPIEPREPMTPERGESSRRAVERVHHGLINSTSHYTGRVHETPERSSAVSVDASQLPIQATRRQSLSLAFLIATDPTPVPSSPSLGDESKLPPLHKLKRKLSQLQDDTVRESLSSPKPVVEEPRPTTHVPDTCSPVLRANTVPPTQSRGEYENDSEPPAKKFKKNIMDWRVRKQALEADPLLDAVETKRVHCKLCDKWIRLDARNDYYPGLWRKHREHHKYKGLGKIGGRSRSSRSDGEHSPENGREQPVRKRRAVGSSRTQRQNHPQEKPRMRVPYTRPSRSSSRITRSSSSFSN